MVKSMTGFGKATVECGNKKIVVEVKSLNSKQLDVNLRLPNLYKEKDIEIRNMIKLALDRGKVDMTIHYDENEKEKDVAVNQEVVAQYFHQMLNVASSLGVTLNQGALLQTIMRFPDTLQIQAEELNEEEWIALRSGIEQALEALNQFREQEGKVLISDILYRIELIQNLANEVPQFEEQRVITIKQRLQEKLNEWSEIKNETAEQEEAPGRKLGFIAQEIGREINTMGSKANDHDIQKLVVRMKDELEKIKEQSLNVL